MDNKYIETLLERYFNAETSLEEESILRAYFSQETLPADMEQWRPLFTAAADEVLGDDFDVRIMEAIAREERPVVKAREITLTQRLKPLFKAAAIVAIILSLGNAAQAPWDNSWNNNQLDEYASYQYELDSVAATNPIQAEVARPNGADLRSENISDRMVDSASVMLPDRTKE